MFIFDIMKRESGRLRIVAICMGSGMAVLLAGLWFLQIVQARQFQSNLIKQSFRTVRIPAIRGRILDCNGLVLAKDRPRYNAILYLEDLQPQFHREYVNLARDYAHEHATGKTRISIPSAMRNQLQIEADCDVVSNITARVSRILREPRVMNAKGFIRHYNEHPYVPFEIVPDLQPRQLAIFAENLSDQPAIEVETQPVRDYPYNSLAAHVIGYVQTMQESFGENVSFTMTDYEGRSGIERFFDDKLRGQPGLKSVLVNSQNYRQSEIVETPDQPGADVYLTIDASVQRAAERALAASGWRGAAVVMDVRNGDILALASEPEFDPNDFLHPVSAAKWEQLSDPKAKPQFNRAISGAYPPGSTFKIITGLACLEAGLDPNAVFQSKGYYQATPESRPIGDTAGAGPFTFERAFYKSSNTYFIQKGLDAGISRILAVAERFHIGQKTGIAIAHEPDNFPKPEDVGHTFPVSRGADMCIGQEVSASPLEMAGMICVIANGGTLYHPRLVSQLRDPASGTVTSAMAAGRVWDQIEIEPRFLEIIRHAMLEDTENPEGTAYKAFHPGGTTPLGNFRVAGKTGTAEVKSPALPYRKVTWFDSYGPYESPRYAVVVMAEDGASGGARAVVAEKIYEALIKRDSPRNNPGSGESLARN